MQKPILLVEDDVVDAMTVERALKEIHVTNMLFTVGNGEEALAYLRNEENARPCVILLDLNMPRMNGVEFLRVVKLDPVMKKIPIVVLTTSRDDQDIIESYKLSAAGYIIKPVDYKKFVEALRTVDVYWTISELPQSAPAPDYAECSSGNC